MIRGWSPAKRDAFRQEFFTFLSQVYIHSKETGGNTCLGDRVYGAQMRALDGIFDGLVSGVHDFKILKSRQLGISTISRAFSLFWLGVHDGLQGAMVFDTDANKENARRELDQMLDCLPDSVEFPRITGRNRYGLTLSNGSKLLFLAAGSRKGRGGGGLGRSAGLNFCHCSEVCSWENQEGIESFKSSLSKKFSNRLYIWESTARGPNLWKQMWEESRSDDLSQKGIFIGWWAREDQRLLKGTLEYGKYSADDLSKKEIERIATVKKKYGVEIDMEQIAWYRMTVDPLQELEQGEEEDPLRRQEQPWDEEEAFVLSGSTFFSNDKLSEIMRRTANSNYDGYKFYPGTEFLQMEIEKAKSARDIQLKVWEEPQHNSVYVVSCDPAYGHDEKNNNSALEVLKCYADKIEQVAEFANASTPTNHFAWVIAAICGWYSGGSEGGFNNSVQLILELNGPGEAVWNEFRSLKSLVEGPYLRQRAKDRGLGNIFSNVRNYIFTRSDSMSSGNAYHWRTTGALKVTIMERLRDFLNAETLIVRSIDALEEMKGVVRDGDTIGAEGWNRDDRTYSLAMAIRAWEEKLRRPLISGNRTKARDDETRRISAEDRFLAFNRHQLDAFMRLKRVGRMQQMTKARYESWRHR